MRNSSSEKWLEDQIREFTEANGGFPIKMLSDIDNGLADRLILWPGATSEFVEVKSTGKKLSKIQSLRRKRIVSMGFRYTTIDSLESLNKWKTSHKN